MQHRLRMGCVFVGIALAAAGCAQPRPVTQLPGTSAEQARHAFGTPVVLKLGESAVFEDGLKIALVKVDDSRCPPVVTCVWAGELAPRLSLKGGRIEDRIEVPMGTTLHRKQSVAGYGITLVDASLGSATLRVERPDSGK